MNDNEPVNESPQAPSLQHKSKQWKDYALEFTMIFLAVTLGFFAESYREYLGDQDKEREYIKSLIVDLKSDEQVIAQHIIHLEKGVSMMDTLITILNTPATLANNTGQLYYLARLAPRLRPLATSNMTFEQLKNSGNFRLIKNINTSNKIMGYYEHFQLITLLQSINDTEFLEYQKIASKIFDPAVFVRTEADNGEIIRPRDNPALRKTSPDLLQELSIFSVYLHGTKKGILAADRRLETARALLVEYLQAEYGE